MKCATIGCPNTPVTEMRWHDDSSIERVCQECADSYSRRPSLSRRVSFSPMLRAGLALAALTLAIVAGPAVAAPDSPGAGRLAPCQTEDQTTACVWDARHTGNGTGRSFMVTATGRVVFLPHYAAHALVFGGAR